jgi:putative ABC transport system permease protein
MAGVIKGFRRAGLLIGSFIIRDLRLNWLRTALTIFGIALGVAVMLAINLANGTTLSRFEESINLVAGRSNLEVRPTATADLDQALLLKLRSLWDENILFTPVIDQMAVVPGSAPDVVQVLGVDMFADPAFRPFQYEGQGVSSGSDNAIFSRGTVYAGERFAERHHLGPGSRFKLLINDRSKEFTVAGIIGYSGPGKTFGGNILLMDIGPAQEAFDMAGRISRVDLIVPKDMLVATAVSLQAQMPSGVAVDRPSRRGQQVEKMVAAFQYNLAALSLIALLVGMFVIYNTMSITVVRKRSEIGVLRALGTSRRRVFSVFMFQAIMLGTLGSLLGVGLGVVFARSAVKAVASTVQALYVDQPPADVSLAWPALVIAFGFGLLMTVIASLAPVIEAMSVPPAEATRRASYERRIASGSPALALLGLCLLAVAAIAAFMPAVDGFPVFGYVSAALTIFGVSFCLPILLSALFGKFIQPVLIPLLGSEGKFAVSSLRGALGRTSVTIASLMLGIAMMMSLAIMIGSFRETVIVWVNQSLKADLYVAPLARATSKRVGKLSSQTVERIRRLSGVSDVDAFVDIPIEYKGKPTNLGAGDIDVLARHGGLMFVGHEDRRSILTRLQHEAGCLITESFALHNNIHDGDVLTLQSPSGPFQVPVLGTYYDYASERGYIVLPRWFYRTHFEDRYSTTLGVYVDQGSDLERVRSEMLNVLGPDTSLSVRTNGELRREVLRVFDNTFAITYALHAVSILVAILGVMNAMLAITIEMRREFAILRAIGASVQQIEKILLVQAGTLGLLGNVLGLAVGFLLSLLLIHVINKQSFGWTVQLNLPVAFLLQSFCLIFAVSIASGWLPARTAGRDVSGEAVRVE